MVSSKATAVYDEHSDWYNELMSPTGGGDCTRRVHAALGDLLGPGDGGTCLDVCCGTGAHASAVAGLGWTPVGVDLSGNRLRHAAERLPVAVADATALPLADGSVPAAVCVLAGTDVPDYPAVLRQIAPVPTPGGRCVHLGVHPCLVGAFADRRDASRAVIDARCAGSSRIFASWNTTGVRARPGARHVPLSDLLNGATAAGLRLERTVEAGRDGIPDLFGFAGVKA
ncbi:methyltransferase domain-containing protein [Streptomyces coeruleorubidus]|uniref:class I SAM-dependent methyltransferase n=1 Tax=Streptomyces coeruleorubidus TaxID=116188 RepID=UPI00237EEE78|nr:methyltransferase domain-containing protein [Streptomyces coeruleorubidus]WDV51881.1 methyltransferase domain-containing protein [Streptomyces coeruleorubidus]